MMLGEHCKTCFIMHENMGDLLGFRVFLHMREPLLTPRETTLFHIWWASNYSVSSRAFFMKIS